MLVAVPHSAAVIKAVEYRRSQRDGSVIGRTTDADRSGWDADYVFVTYPILHKWIVHYGVEKVCRCYDVVILDEIHILPATTIVLLAMLCSVLHTASTRVVLMSATVNSQMCVECMASHGCALFHIPGRQFTLKQLFAKAPWGLEIAYAAKLVHARWKQLRGGVLVFLAGAPEINKFVVALKNHLGDRRCVLFRVEGRSC